jgi:hypothetical protein
MQTPTLRYVLAWLALLGGLTFGLHRSWHYFDKPGRNDGNEGHTLIDFGGQWLMGRLLVEGQGRHLYDRDVQRSVLRRAYPRADEDPGAEDSDADKLMSWMMGDDAEAGGRNIGGPLYPPLNAFVCAPLGLLPPHSAYRLAQLLNVLLIFACGLLLVRLSEGRLWWPLATLLLTAFPGFGGSLNLGQNSSLSLALLLGGWLLLRQGRDGWAGVVWGLLAFKPTWAAAFFLVPLVTARWRMALAMLATGLVLVVATLPFVGVGAWLDWLRVGREASALYAVDQNWIDQSRDLLGTGRRWLLDFGRPGKDRGPAAGAATLLGWGMLGAVLIFTVGLTLRLRRGSRQTEGPAPAFILLGAWLSCFHFIYYDVLLAALPVALLFLDPRCYLRPSLVPRPTVPLVLGVLLLIMPNVWFFLPPDRRPPMQIPWDQYLLVLLWLWCGWAWARQVKGGWTGGGSPR